MRAWIAVLFATIALSAAIAATPAAADYGGRPRTSNPGVPWYYPNPDAAATQRFQQVYDTCQATHRQYGERVRVGGVSYTCP